MELKEKVYQYIQNNAIFNKKVITTIEIVFKGLRSSRISRNKIENSLIELHNEGKLKIEGGMIKTPTEPIVGTFYKAHNGNGTVVVKKDGKVVEYFVPEKYTQNAQSKSRVSFVLQNEYTNRVSAQVVTIVEQNNDLVYGAMIMRDNKCVFAPDDYRYKNNIEMVQNEFAKKAISKRCSVHISQVENTTNSKIIGEIKSDDQIFGFINNPMAIVASLLAEEGVSTKFPDKVYEETNNISTKVEEIDCEGRLDLRDKNFITIDPATCKDMDDAVYIEELVKYGVPAGYRLYVAIADVANYVKEESEIDAEAYKRGTSIYPAGTVVPMLPEKLSNGICSLSKDEDRLAMITVMEIGKNGKIHKYDFYNGVINSKQKFSYEEVSNLYHNDKKMLEKFGQFKPSIDMLYDLSDCMGRRAEKENALTIEGYQPTIILNDEKTKVIDFKNDNKVDSHKVIEHAMVANNSVIANFLNGLGVNNILRIHDNPSEKRFELLKAKLMALGIDIEGLPDGKTYQDILALIGNGPLSKVKNSLVVRSMKKAKYDIDVETGHFALALKEYTHFTSPIRRYVDLIEHRLIKKSIELLNQVIKESNIDTKNKSMSDLVPQLRHCAKKQFNFISNEIDLYNKAFHLNKRNDAADEISKKADLVCGILYMQEQIGSIKKGYISNVDKGSITITLYDKADIEHSDIIDVVVPFEELTKGRKYYANTDGGTLIDMKTGKILYMLGDMVDIKIMSADPNTRTIIASTDLEKEITKDKEEISLN